MIQGLFRAVLAVPRYLFVRTKALTRHRDWKRVTIGAVVILILGFAASSFLGGGSQPLAAESDNTIRSVEVSSVADLTSQTVSLSVSGSVSSKSEATVRTESSGEVTGVYRELGDFVGAGAIVAELENASERAAVLQAEASVEAAKASAGVSQTTLGAAKGGAVNSLLSAYATTDNAIRADADPMFANPETQPQFTVPTSDSQARVDIENIRVALGTVLARQKARSSTLSVNDDLASELIQTEKELRQVREFFDKLIVALNAGIATAGVSAETIAAYKVTAAATRTTITTSLSAIVSAKQALETAEKNLSQGGPSASSASLKQAEAGLAAARANLEKTIIRAPISGTINSLSLERGDYVGLSSPVLTVANNGALEAVAYITQNDRTRIAVGDPVTIEGTVKGTITRVAPALDPVTKKIEVRIGLPANTKDLVNGQSVVIRFDKASSGPAKPITGPLTIPISALKIGSQETVVFTVDAANKLVPHPVEIGTLQGDRVAITSGITADMLIVTDARGLQPGQEVEVE